MRTSLRGDPRPEPPKADCTADSAGGLTFDVALPGQGERWDAALLLRPCGRGTAPSVRLPLFPSGDGLLRAALPSTMPLAEGRWDGLLALGEEGPLRLLSGRHDLCALSTRDPGGHRTWFGVRVPYSTGHGELALRSWLRWPHAEVGEVGLGAAGLRLTGRLHGTASGGDLGMEARRRVEGDDAGGEAQVVRAAAREVGGEFRATLPYEALTRPGDWDLWLCTASGLPVRLARILDDVADKRRLLRYRPQRGGGPRGHAVLDGGQRPGGARRQRGGRPVRPCPGAVRPGRMTPLPGPLPTARCPARVLISPTGWKRAIRLVPPEIPTGFGAGSVGLIAASEDALSGEDSKACDAILLRLDPPPSHNAIE